MRVYFAHPISFYGTELERAIIKTLAQGGFEVINPSDPAYQRKVHDLRTQYTDRDESSRKVMEYFVQLCSTCEACVFLPFPDGTLGAGVVQEAQSFLARGKKVYVASFEDRRLVLKELPNLDAFMCLDVPATRAALKKFERKPGFR